MRKLAKKMNNLMFDVAPGPILLVLVGIPILVIVIVVILIIVAVKLIKRARKKNIEAKELPEDYNSPGEDQ